MVKILSFDGKINEDYITIISYKNGIIVGDFGSKMNVCYIKYSPISLAQLNFLT